MPADDVPDSTDWLSTPLNGFAAVEAALRCQVCKDFYTTPVITSCSHTFCSLCIRRALSNDGRCPLCRAADQELKLRSNWSMEETVESFTKVRASALELARNQMLATRSPKRKAEDAHPAEAHVAPEPKRLRTSARLNRSYSTLEQASPEIPQEVEDVIEASDDDEYVPDNPDGLVPCPVCQRTMKAWQVFKHLETCPGPSSVQDTGEASTPSHTFGQMHRQRQKTLDRLPALNYSMLKDNMLRKKLSDLRISNQGPRPMLEKRHKEWITLWNANCDAANPKKHSELLQDLDIWERTQGARAPTTGRSVQNAAAIKDKDFDGTAWAAKHNSSFKDLIESARKSRLEAKTRTSGEDEEPIPAEEPAVGSQPPSSTSASRVWPVTLGADTLPSEMAPLPGSGEPGTFAPVNPHPWVPSDLP